MPVKKVVNDQLGQLTQHQQGQKREIPVLSVGKILITIFVILIIVGIVDQLDVKNSQDKKAAD